MSQILNQQFDESGAVVFEQMEPYPGFDDSMYM